MKKFTKTVLAVLVAISVVSCGVSEGEVSQTTEETGDGELEDWVEETEDATTVVDRMGNEVNIPKEVNAIVSLAPAITETLVDLGLGDKIVAIDTYSIIGEGMKEDVLTFDMMTPDVESIIALEPDLILASGISLANSNDPFIVAKDLGITVSYIPSANSLEEIRDNIWFIGGVTKTTDRANEIVEDFDTRLTKIKEEVAKYEGEKRKVYFEISPAPDLYSFGQGVFLNEVLEILGTENIFAELESWAPVTEEEVLARNPQVIFTNTYIENPVNEILGRKGWENVDAVASGNVFYVDQKYSSQDNENVIIAIEEMAAALYPDFKVQ